MSLTSLLGQHDSPVYKFLSEEFPHTQSVVREQNKKVSGARTIRPDGNPPWTTLGVAIDYRIRYYFQTKPYRELVAWRGATLINDDPGTWEDITEEDAQGLCGVAQMAGIQNGNWGLVGYGDNETIMVRERDGRLQRCMDHDLSLVSDAMRRSAALKLPRKLIESFFNDIDRFLGDAVPSGKLLERPEEELLARYCYVLALFEQVARSGRLDVFPILGEREANVHRLLSIPADEWVDDICNMSRLFYESCQEHLLEMPILNPTFEGSRDVGGADADMIIGSCLIDIKTTVRARIERNWLYQLLGYVLLDYGDIYRLESVGVYLARQGTLIRWPLRYLIGGLSGSTMHSPEYLQELRSRFQAVAQSIKDVSGRDGKPVLR